MRWGTPYWAMSSSTAPLSRGSSSVLAICFTAAAVSGIEPSDHGAAMYVTVSEAWSMYDSYSAKRSVH